MVQFASYLRRVLYKTRLIFPRINGPIVYFEVTRHLTMKLFPANSPERATLQKNYDVRGNNAMLPANVDR